jgi:hypothetical protein
LFCTGYLAYELPEFADYYQENYVQLPLQKGDCAFFNPALFHAAGKEEPPLFAPFYTNNWTFAKTGSGQTRGKI